MNHFQRSFYDTLCRKLFKAKVTQKACRYSCAFDDRKWKDRSGSIYKTHLVSVNSKENPITVKEEPVSSNLYLQRTLEFVPKYVKQREVWIENLDAIKEEKRGLVELHPKIFATIPRLDLVHYNIRWQNLYKVVNLYSAKTRAEALGGGRKPHPQKGTGRARQGSIRAPHFLRGGTAHGPRNPKTYFYMLPYSCRVHGLTSVLTIKHAQDDLHVVDNIEIPTDNSQFMLDLVKERNWGPSVLIVDKEDIMPQNITLATDTIGHINLMPAYSLNVYSMLKHVTLVLTLRAVDEIENKLLKVLNTARDSELARDLSPYPKKY